jgi:hypothetical protein
VLCSSLFPSSLLTLLEVDKFADFTNEALIGIKEWGASCVWYTDVSHHAVINNYYGYSIFADHPDVAKGRAVWLYVVKSLRC